MEDFEDQPRVKRFKHQSYQRSLKEVHLTPAHNQTRLHDEITDNDSHFHQRLDHWRQLNLSPAFLSFANKANGLSASMPLLLHNWKEIISLWITVLESSDNEGLQPLFDLLHTLVHDLRTTLSPVYHDLLQRLLNLLPRAIDPQALTTLLDTFSTLFKYILVPAVQTTLLEQTWTALRTTLKICHPEIQRAMAEVWGSVLRRLKSSAREKAVFLLAESAWEIEDAAAWVLVFACKSVSQTLHTATGSILSPLLTYHLTTATANATHTLLRRVLTALIHHVKNAEGYTPVADVLIKQLLGTIKSTDSEKEGCIERLRRILDIFAIPAAARQGSRLAQYQLSTILADLPLIPLSHPSLHPALLRFTTSTFTAAEMPLWVGPVYKFFQRLWSSKDESTLKLTLNLNLSLAELGWGGWKLVALPQLLKNTMNQDALELDPRRLLSFIAGVKRLKKLSVGDTDFVWRERMEKFVLQRLESWSLGGDAEAVVELDDILTISGLLSTSITPVIAGLVDRILSSPPSDAEAEYRETPANSASVLGACMQALLKRDQAEWGSVVDVGKWTESCVRHWGWSHEVLGGLYALSQAKANLPSSDAVSLDEAYPFLKASLQSYSRPLRLAVLRLLGSPNLISSPPTVADVVRRCLQGEEVPLDAQGVRERVLRIGRVGVGVSGGKEGDTTGADIAVRWLIAQLKVNLRPIWSPAAGALSSLTPQFGDIVWKLLFTELKALDPGGDCGLPNGNPPWMFEIDNVSGTREEERDGWETERSWRDPSAHKLLGTTRKVWDDGTRVSEFAKTHSIQERLDLTTYESQLLATLGECVPLVEKHNRELVPYFLSLAGPDATSRLPKHKLVAWLKLFSKFNNPKALHSTATLRTLYLTQLSHPDRVLQTAALSCLFTYKSPQVTPHEEKLKALLDDTRWRDELTNLDLGAIDPFERAGVVDVVIRLLFGVMLERKGGLKGADRRAAVLSTLAGCTEDELGLLVDLMLRPLGSASTAEFGQVEAEVGDKQKTGFLMLLGDVMKNLGTRIVRYWPSLIGATVELVADAQKRVEVASSTLVFGAGEGELLEAEGEEGEGFDDTEDAGASSTKIARSIRQLGLKRLADFFRSPVKFDFTPWMRTAFDSFICSRLPSLDKENTQAPSALLELFYTWSQDEEYARFLVEYDRRVLPKIYECLIAPSVKPAVINRIFDIVDHLLAASSVNEGIRDTIIKPHISILLSSLSVLVQQTKGVSTVATPLAQRQISILSEVAIYSTDSKQAQALLGLFAPPLKKPAKLVPEKVKVDLLRIITNLMPLIPQFLDRTSDAYRTTYTLLSQLFQSLRSRPARLGLVATFQHLSQMDLGLRDLAVLLESLNAYSIRRVDEPDFERRLEAFATLNETHHKSLLTSDWLPVVYCMLYFIHDPVELAIRNNASFTMRHFVDLVASNPNSEFESTFLRVLYPGVKNGLRSRNEMVRAEILGVLAYAVQNVQHLGSLQEMRVLLADGDEEANFFNNILHVQVHRRSRALRRLGDYCEEGHLRSSTLADIFVPLVGDFILSNSSMDHHLVNDAILATGRMAGHLAWGAYYSLVQKYLRLSRAKDESEKVYVRVLVAVLDRFHFPMEETVPEADEIEPEEEGEDQADEGPKAGVEQAIPPLANTVPAPQITRISDAVNHKLLPTLLNHLEKRDPEADDSTSRISLSIGIVTVAKHLPPATREPQITRLLTILSQILRSRSQDMRDHVREALCRIAVALGPSYLPLILRELRGALLRGPHLHVLAFVTHSVIVHVTSGVNAEAFGILDDCVNDLAHVSAEVIFGESGKDVQAEDFKTKMREVRGSASRGLDTFATVAKYITPPKISSLLLPLRSIMQETESIKVMNLVEEVLKRVSGGLNSNKHLVPTDLLVLCNTLISQNAKFLQQAPAKHNQKAKDDAIVQVKRQKAPSADHYANNSYRFVAFGLDLFQTALRRNRFDFHNLAVMSRLDAMIVVVGNALYSTSAPVLLLGLRCTAGLSKCPLKSLEKSAPVFVRRSIEIIQQAGNTESEVVQVALKSLATIFREGPAVQVKEKDLVYLLELLAPDLEEPSRQASVFTMLRAIVARKFVVPEIYDLMEKVSEVMVTNQSSQVQELCRGVLLQFLLDYPQGKGRLRKQMTFFAKNLSYVYESGRKSVMELLGAVVSKFQAGLIQEYSDLLFVALVMVVANDDSAKCREMGSHLIKSLFTRLDDERRQLILSHLHSWALQQAQPQLVQVSCQVYGFIIDILQTDSLQYMDNILEDIGAAVSSSAQAYIATEAADPDIMSVDLEWQGAHQALTVFEKILRIFPDFAQQEDKIPWNLIVTHLLFPHSWVRTASSRLLGLLFTTVPAQAPGSAYPDDHPLSAVGMKNVAERLCLQLKSEHLDQALALQVVKNLFYVGKCFYAAAPVVDASSGDEDQGGEEPKDLKLVNPLPWLFSKLSYQIRSAHIARRNRASSSSNWSQQPLAILRWLAAMASHMDAERVEQFLVHILTPVYRLLEDDTIRDPQMQELKTLSTELQDLIQSKVGVTKFSATYTQIRQGALGVRRDRKSAKVLQVTTNPEAAAKRKAQRNAIKKESRKRKDRGFAERQGKMKRRRAE